MSPLRDPALDAIARHYAQLLAQHGDVPAAAQWSDRATQEARMAALLGVGDVRSAKVLDFGCGTGHLLTVLRERAQFNGTYVGYDLSPEIVEVARRKHPDARFEARDILADGIDEDFDFVFASGTFNNRLTDNWSMVTRLLKTLWPRTKRALAFNALSIYVDFFDEGLWYVEPERLFRFCKEELSPCVTLRHDYFVRPGVVPFEFCLYVYATDVAPRAARPAP